MLRPLEEPCDESVLDLCNASLRLLPDNEVERDKTAERKDRLCAGPVLLALDGEGPAHVLVIEMHVDGREEPDEDEGLCWVI